MDRSEDVEGLIMSEVNLDHVTKVATEVITRTMYGRSGLVFFDECRDFILNDDAEIPQELKKGIIVGLAYDKALRRIIDGSQDNDDAGRPEQREEGNS
jgi:hypothetical protein